MHSYRTFFSLSVLAAAVFLISATVEENDPLIKTKAQLGKKLFSEKILSKDSSVSCAVVINRNTLLPIPWLSAGVLKES
jgi:cytochrome c peroxidase